METEKRFVEFRSAGEGKLSGTAIRFGDQATIGSFTETFEPGSLRFSDVIVNLQHDRGKPVARTGAGLDLRESRTELRADIDLPDTVYAREAKELVDAKIIRGMSLEFRNAEDSWDGNHRTIHRAELMAIGLVDRPAYSDSQIEARFAEMASDAPKPRRRLL